MVGFEIEAISCFQKIHGQRLFLVMRFLNSFLLNFNLLIFWVIVGNHLTNMKNCIDMFYN